MTIKKLIKLNYYRVCWKKKRKKTMLVFTVICTLLKMKEQNNEYLDYFSENEMVEVSMKIFNANCVDYT